jgi:Tol biopolymer transport system component
MGRVARVLVLATVVAATGARGIVHAACNIIPSAVQTYRGALGTANRPFAGPADIVELRVRPGVCDQASLGFESLDPAQYVVTVVFTPPDGGPRNVVFIATDPTGLGPCPGAASTTPRTAGANDLAIVLKDGEQRLQFRFPDTDAELQLAGDDRTFTGPAVIAVTPRAAPLPCGLVTGPCADQSGLLACLDDLYELDGSCRPLVDFTFPHFTALPPPNRYEALCTSPAFPTGPCLGSAPEARFAVDTKGNILFPIDWQGILVDSAVPVPRLLRGSSSIDALSVSTGPIRLPGQAFVQSRTPEGALLPPIFLPQVDPSALNEVTLFGSADAPLTVLRVSRKSPAFKQCVGGDEHGRPCTETVQCPGGGACNQATCAGGPAVGQVCDEDEDCPSSECGPALFEFRDRLVAQVGPVVVPRDVLTGDEGVCEDGADAGEQCVPPTPCADGADCVDYRIVAENPVPLEGLAGTEDVFTFSVRESIANDDLNDDGDELDLVLTFQDRVTGQSIPTGDGCPAPGCPAGRAIAAIHQPPFAFPALASEGDVVAFLEPERAQGVDTNQNERDVDSILRVYRRSGATTAVAVTGSQVITTDESPEIDGRSLAVSAGRVFFRATEPAGADHTTVRISANTSGAEADGESGVNRTTAGDTSWQSFSADGRYVAFDSVATDLTPTPPSPPRQIYVRDRDFDGNGIFDEAGPGATTTVRVSVVTAGDAGGNNHSFQPSISADGRHVAFFSRATNLFTPCGGCSGVIYVHDRDKDEDGIFDEADVPGPPEETHTALVSVNDAGTNGGGFAPAISGNGRFVAFSSAAANLLPTGTDTNGLIDIFVHDRDADEDGEFDETGPGERATEGVSVTATGDAGNGNSHFIGTSDQVPPGISHDGRWIAFHSASTDLVPSDPTGTNYDVYLRDRSTQTTSIAQSDGAFPSLSSDGRFLACRVAGIAVVRDLETGSLTSVSVDHDGTSLAAGFYPKISADGRFVVFTSPGTDLVPDDTNASGANGTDVFVRDLLTATTMRANVTSAGFQSPVGLVNPMAGESPVPAISPDGRWVAFWQNDPLLASDDGSAIRDVYVRGPGSVGTDHTGDGALDDVVLGVLDGEGGEGTPPTMLCPAGQVSVAAGRAAFLRPEAAGRATGCPGPQPPGAAPDLDGDLEADDLVVHLWDGASTQNLGLAATQVVLSDTTVAAIAGTVQVHPVGPGVWTDTGQAADTIGYCGNVLAMITPEAEQGVPLNDDGLEDDRVLQLWVLGTGVVVNTRQAAEEFVCDAGLVAFRTRESAQAENLNAGAGDGDQFDDVLQVWDLGRPECLTVSPPASCLANTGQAVRICALEACDRASRIACRATA